MTEYSDLFSIGKNNETQTRPRAVQTGSQKSDRYDRFIDLKDVCDGDRLSFFNGKCSVRVTNSFSLREKAYRFQFKAYEKLGIVSPQKEALWLTIHDALPQTTTFIAEDISGEMVGTITLVFDSPLGLPADSLFPSEVQHIRRKGRRICELISFGASSKMRGSVKILAGLFYSSLLFARFARNATDYVITVHERHERFYCSNLLFSRSGPVRCYSKVNDEPTVFLNLALELPERLRGQKRIFPFSLFTYSEPLEHRISQKIDTLTAPLSPVNSNVCSLKKRISGGTPARPKSNGLRHCIFPTIDHSFQSNKILKNTVRLPIMSVSANTSWRQPLGRSFAHEMSGLGRYRKLLNETQDTRHARQDAEIIPTGRKGCKRCSVRLAA